MIGQANPDQATGAAASNAARALARADQLDGAQVGLINLQPTRGQRLSALATVGVLLIAVTSVAPYTAKTLPRFAAFVPFMNATILVTDLITAILLFALFSISRSRALLVLAGGYLFTALMVIPHALTFPGAFSPEGLLGAGPQTTAWLYTFWHLGFPASLSLYVWLKDEDYTVQGSLRSAIGWCCAISIGLVVGLVWLTIAGDPLLPRLFLNASDLGPLGFYVTYFDLLMCVVALAFLWTRRRSVLDLWLMVVACALISELALASFRFSLGFYVNRLFSFVTATIVLVVLLAETTGLYTRLALANALLRRERDNKLMNLAAVVASISHEVKQPLAAIVMRSSTALRFLGHSPPDIEKARSTLNKIVKEGHRASEIFDNIRDLFRPSQERVKIDVNEIVLRILDLLKRELTEHHIAVRTELTHDLPCVMGHSGQLQEVLLNLIFNAIEAMDGKKSGDRVLRLKTERREGDGIAISVIDTGPGIDPRKLDNIFDAFVTNKAQGLGLGLAICRMIVERHGGHLLASSGQEGGARFDIILPAAPLGNSEGLLSEATKAHHTVRPAGRR
jgi:signal transduction histidine kinase